jgi:replicative DNA helicase
MLFANPDPERALIGGLMADNSQISPVRQLVEKSFFKDSACAIMYDAVLSAFDEYGAATVESVTPRLLSNNISVTDLLRTMDERVIGAYSVTDARLIVEKYMMREGRKVLEGIIPEFNETNLGTASGIDVADSLSLGITRMIELQRLFQKGGVSDASSIAHSTLEEIDELLAGRNKAIVPFCFPEIDTQTGGMDKADLVVLAGLEKSGKSTLMIQILHANAMRGLPVLLFSTEMRKEQIFLRHALIRSQIRYLDLRRGALAKEGQDKLIGELTQMAGLPFYVRDGALTITEILSDAEKYVSRHGVKLIAVDYIQRIIPLANERANETREREVAAISSGLKNIGMKLHVPVLALSQLNEDMRARESRSIEQDMDKMLTIEKIEQPDPTEMMVGIKIRQRFGPSGNFGDVRLKFNLAHGFWISPESSRLENLVPWGDN